eukprot:7519091-Prorocentrum_lima.AAC.1
MGLRKLRQDYTPIPYSRKTTDGRHVPLQDIPEQAAVYLENSHWGLDDTRFFAIPSDPVITESI